MRMPSRAAKDVQFNLKLVEEIGLTSAPYVRQGRPEFRTLAITSFDPVKDFLDRWARSPYSPGWLQDEFVEAMERAFVHRRKVTMMLMEDDGKARTRKWVDNVGFVNLFQGRDLKPQPNGDFYPGDRSVLDLEKEPQQIIIQVHRTVIRDHESEGEVPTLAVYLGSGLIARKDPSV
jgi:hypothetical protein